MSRTPFDILAEYERRSLAHAVVLPAVEQAPDQWRGVGYRVGQRRLVSNFAAVLISKPLAVSSCRPRQSAACRNSGVRASNDSANTPQSCSSP